MTVEDLQELAEQEQARQAKFSHRIMYCAAAGCVSCGSMNIRDILRKALQEKDLASQVEVIGTGCMGLCYVEPTVEVVVPGMPTVIYGKMTSDAAEDLVVKHLIERSLLDNHILDRPAADIIAKGGK